MIFAPRFKFFRELIERKKKKKIKKKNEKQQDRCRYHRSSCSIIFCSTGVLHDESAAVGEARFGIVCASSNRHSLKAWGASFEKRALEHFAYVDVRCEMRRAREALCAMMTFPLWDRLGSPRQQQYTTGANTGELLRATSRRWNLKGLSVRRRNGSDGARLEVRSASRG